VYYLSITRYCFEDEWMTAKCYLHQCFRNLAVSLLASSVARNSQPTSRCAKYPLTALTAEIPPATEYALMDPCCTWGNRQFGPITTVRETATFSLIPAVFPRDYSSKRPPLFFGIADHGDTHRPLSLRAPGLDLMKGVTSAPRNPNRGKTKEKNPPLRLPRRGEEDRRSLRVTAGVRNGGTEKNKQKNGLCLSVSTARCLE